MDIKKYGDSFAIGSFKNVVINVLRGNPGVSSFNHIIEHTREVARSYPERQYVINIMQRGAFLPSAEERKVLGEKRAELEAVGKVTNMFVIEATGFISASFRAVVAGVSFLASKQQLMFATTDDAIKSLVQDLPIGDRLAYTEGLRKAIEEIRKA
ncbi:MAG: hypothetical protein QM765_06855 [Myxococcales bacterium]